MGAGSSSPGNTKNKPIKPKGIGEYCKNESFEECRRLFGEGLAMVCSTCPD